MIGIDQRRIRLLPTRSMRRRAAHVMRKFVTATVSDVKVGLSNPKMVKIVAEKYISEFYKSSQLRVKWPKEASLRSRKVAGGLAISKQSLRLSYSRQFGTVLSKCPLTQ